MLFVLKSVSSLFSSSIRGWRTFERPILVRRLYGNGAITKSVIFLNLENWTNVLPKFLSDLPTLIIPLVRVSPIIKFYLNF